MASGALPFAKGDVRVQGKLRIENKLTQSGTYVLRWAVLKKIVSEAQRSLEIPVLQLDFIPARLSRPSLQLAVTQETPQPGDRILVETTNKSIALSETEVSTLLLPGALPCFFVAFVDDKTGDKGWYRVEHWALFLDRYHQP